MKIIISSLLLCFYTQLCAAQADTLALNRAEKLESEKKYDDALKIYNGLLAKDSSIARYYEKRSGLYYDQSKFQLAANDLSRAMELEPNNAKYYYFMALVMYSSENPTPAINNCNDALKYINPRDSLKYPILMLRGNAEAMKRDFSAAYEDYKVIIAYDSTNCEVLSNMGMALSDMKREKEAVACLEKVKRLCPDKPIGYTNLALLLQNSGDYERSIETINEGLKHLATDDVTVRAIMYNNRSYDKLKLQKLKEAMDDVNQSLKLYPSNSYALRNRALIYLAMKQKDKACEDLREALKQGFTLMYGNEVKELMKANCPADSIPNDEDDMNR